RQGGPPYRGAWYVVLYGSRKHVARGAPTARARSRAGCGSVRGAMPDQSQRPAIEGALPRGELASRVLAMPTDTNPRGDIFGGWIMSLMDMAGKMSATSAANG